MGKRELGNRQTYDNDYNGDDDDTFCWSEREKKTRKESKVKSKESIRKE